MGTRGFIGFVADGTEKIAYNHFDSYPDGLGMTVLGWLRRESAKMPNGFEWVRERARALRVVDPQSEPTDEDIEALKDFYNPNVGGRRDRPDWYQLLRETQGNPGLILRAGVIEDAAQFPMDSLYAEWGYLVDVDAGTFEVYRGFQHEPHDRGRFADRERATYSSGIGPYYPCALVASWPLNALPSDDDFVKTVHPEDEE